MTESQVINKNTKTVAVVILNWNGIDFLQKFLPSVISFSPNADIYVVDNCSSDQSVSYLKQSHPEVRIIENNKNEGFCQGYNLGLQKIKADYFILLNSDVEVTENWIWPVIEILESEPAFGIAQPKIKSYQQKDYFEYAGGAGGFLDKFGYPYCKGRIFETVEKDQGQYNQMEEITWASGACFFIKSKVWHELGGFDADFFAHMEEIDLCWRAKNINFKSIYVPFSTVYHVGAGTLNKTSPFKTYLNFRNGLFLLHKNLPKQKLFSTIFTRLILDGIAGLKFLLSGEMAHIFSILKAHFSYYSQISKLNKKRSANHVNVLQPFSIVWAYFVEKKKYFNEL